MLFTTTSDINPNIQGWYDRNLLERATPELLYGLFGQTRPVPNHAGTRITFRRYGALPPNLTRLLEGITPAGKKLSATDIYATLEQFGDYVVVTDVLTLTGLDNHLLEAGEVLGEQSGQTIDLVTRDKLMAGTSVRYANGVASRGLVTAKIADSDIRVVLKTLEGNNAAPIRERILPGAKINTYGIRPSFMCLAHTNCRADIESLTGFRAVEDYASMKDVHESEIGSVKNVRFMLSTHGKKWAESGAVIGATGLEGVTNIDVYGYLFLARNAYGTIPLQKTSVKNIIKQLGSSGVVDALDQRASSGWKCFYTARILNDAFMCRVEAGVTK